MAKVTLKAGNETIEVERVIAEMSKFVRDNLEKDKDEKESVPIDIDESIKISTLKKVIEWAEYHKSDFPKQTVKIDYKDKAISKWDNEFLAKVDLNLADLMNAANILKISDLEILCAKAFANMIKGKTAEQHRKQFNIENDFPGGGKPSTLS